jgi:hypothetical protein
MKTTLRTGALAPRQRHLGHDLGAAELAQQPRAAGHAEHAAHRAADLAWTRTAPSRGSSTLSTVWPSCRPTEQPHRAVLARRAVERTRASPSSCLDHLGQRPAQRRRKEVLRAAPAVRGGRAASQLRSSAASCSGPAPRAARRWRMASMSVSSMGSRAW